MVQDLAGLVPLCLVLFAEQWSIFVPERSDVWVPEWRNL